jgi:SAM-dependent methyltransferase
MDIDNQTEYWNKVAAQKEFTHPLNHFILGNYFSFDSMILDYGCGYGRIVNELIQSGYKNIIGYDTSAELIKRGKQLSALPIQHIKNPAALPIDNDSVDLVILFAVLTCIPSNKGQQDLIKTLHSKLKPGGIIYISDYYIQENRAEVGEYSCLEDDPENYGVFTLPEGVMFRHHTKEWISHLLKDFCMIKEYRVDVKTMNGNSAEAFQLIIQKH